MRIGLLTSIAASFFVGWSLACVQIVEAQDDSDMSDDSHFREELGVNQYTTPSIEHLFDTLDSLKPIPIQELTRPPRALRLDNRVKFALSFGVLIGDGFLAVFDGPARGVRCACSIADEISLLGIEVRAGLHTGECEVMGDDYGGIAVHIGARVAALAGAGEVLVSSTVKDLVAGSGLRFIDYGARALKGVEGEWRIFAVDR